MSSQPKSKRQSYEILRSSLVQNLRNGGLNRQITPKQNELEREEDLVGIMKSEDLKSGDLKSDSVPLKKESSNKILSSLSDSQVLISRSSSQKINKSMRSIELLASKEIEQ